MSAIVKHIVIAPEGAEEGVRRLTLCGKMDRAYWTPRSALIGCPRCIDLMCKRNDALVIRYDAAVQLLDGLYDYIVTGSGTHKATP